MADFCGQVLGRPFTTGVCDTETEWLTALGAALMVEEVYQAPIRLTSFTDPDGNRFQPAT